MSDEKISYSIQLRICFIIAAQTAYFILSHLWKILTSLFPLLFRHSFKIVQHLKANKEITALLHLIDDPDEDIYNTVSDKIISFGKDIIPNLENLWENTSNEEIQERIELLIHRLHFRDLTNDFTEWAAGDPDLMEGALLVARYHYPDMDTTAVYQEIEKLRRNTWLELNNYLTPIEQINIVTSIFYNYYKQKGVEFAYNNPDDYLVNKSLESKKGNALSNGIIYIVLCELLDIPVKAINIPRQFIMGYFDPQHDLLNPVGHASEKINFFIDPLKICFHIFMAVHLSVKRVNKKIDLF